MPGIDRTKPEDMEPIDAAAYLCWGSGRGDLYDAIHAMKKDNERLREAFKDYVDHVGCGTAIRCEHCDKARSALQQKESE